MKVSAVILTKNSENTIIKCLDSIDEIVDEIIIVDDFSEDKTLSLVKKYKNTIIFQRSLKNNFSKQRNFGIGKVSNKFVMHIDSDEFLSDELKNSIEKEIPLKEVCYYVNRKNLNFYGFAMEKLINRPLICPKNLKFRGALHEYVVSKNKKRISGSLIHDCWVDLEEFVNDLNEYSTRKARTWIEQKRNYSTFYLLIRQIALSFYLFFGRFFYQKRFLFGTEAFFYCFYWASEEILVGLKYIEMKRRK